MVSKEKMIAESFELLERAVARGEWDKPAQDALLDAAGIGIDTPRPYENPHHRRLERLCVMYTHVVEPELIRGFVGRAFDPVADYLVHYPFAIDNLSGLLKKEDTIVDDDENAGGTLS